MWVQAHMSSVEVARTEMLAERPVGQHCSAWLWLRGMPLIGILL